MSQSPEDRAISSASWTRAMVRLEGLGELGSIVIIIALSDDGDDSNSEDSVMVIME